MSLAGFMVHAVDVVRRKHGAKTELGGPAGPELHKKNVSCRIQHGGGGRNRGQDINEMNVGVNVYFNSDPDIANGDLLVIKTPTALTGTKLYVDSIKDTDLLGRLWKAECNEVKD